jgi:hypothetical protein
MFRSPLGRWPRDHVKHLVGRRCQASAGTRQDVGLRCCENFQYTFKAALKGRSRRRSGVMIIGLGGR